MGWRLWQFILISKVRMEQGFHRTWPLLWLDPYPRGLKKEKDADRLPGRLPFQCLVSTWCPVEVVWPYRAWLSRVESSPLFVWPGHS